jgi:hypothetical protein
MRAVVDHLLQQERVVAGCADVRCIAGFDQYDIVALRAAFVRNHEVDAIDG